MIVNVYSMNVDKNKNVALNFKVSEFACKDGSDTVFISQDLINILQLVRDHFKKPVIINSAYRTPTYNKKVGGAGLSKHCQGIAADIVVQGIKPSEVANYVETLLLNTGGIGRYSTFTHVDVRLEKSRWIG